VTRPAGVPLALRSIARGVASVPSVGRYGDSLGPGPTQNDVHPYIILCGHCSAPIIVTPLGEWRHTAGGRTRRLAATGALICRAAMPR
jgi:hypothetical protein